MTRNKLLILNGPGLSDLSTHESINFPNLTLEKIRHECAGLCQQLGIKFDFRQTDDENEMFRQIVEGSKKFDALIINPVGYTQATLVNFEIFGSAIKTIAQLKKPVIEVHITNIFNTGAKITKPLQVPVGEIGFISGLGLHSYLLAITSITKKLN